MPRNESIHPLSTEQLPPNCFLFKHSTRCSVSAAAAEAVKAHTWSLPLFWLNVVEQRPLSNWAAQHYGVEHESPQLLLIRDNRVEKVFNHGQIRAAIAAGRV